MTGGDDPAVAAVGASGRLTATGPGRAELTARAGIGGKEEVRSHTVAVSVR